MAPTDDNYWADYDGLQKSKHQLLRTYLGGWFPKLAWSGRVLYIDCHAGRGRHATGDEGSPILALRLLLEHKGRARILDSAEVQFLLFEKDAKNFTRLQSEIQKFGTLPKNIVVRCAQADYADELRHVIDSLHSTGSQLAPAFAFVDPYGFTLSMDLLNSLLSFQRCELLINFMYRYVDMAIGNPSQADNMDSLFGSKADWRRLASISDPTRRSEETIAMFSAQLRAKYVTHLQMRASNHALKYVLIHATNHREGRKLMKQALWTVTPDGSFSASERDDPRQPVLIVGKPNLKPLKSALWQEFGGRKASIEALEDWLVDQLYLPKHLHQVIREYRNRDIIEATGYEGGFAFNKSPSFLFPTKPPADEV